MEPFGRHQPLPVDLLAFLGPLGGSQLQDLLRSRFTRTLDEVHCPPQDLLHPASAFVLAPVAGVQPLVREAREQPLGMLEQRLDPLLVHHVGWLHALLL